MSKLRLTVSRLLALGGLTAVSGSGIALYQLSQLGEGSIAECSGPSTPPNTPADYGKKETDPLQTRSKSNWNDNWDFRNPNSISPKVSIPVLDDNGTTINVPAKPLKSTATRHVILIRHGHYVWANDDTNRVLSELGRQQACSTGERLKSLNLKYNRLVVSTMTRARETASIISEFVPGVATTQCSLLREGSPYPPEPTPSSWQPEQHQLFQDNSRIEAAFRKYIHRAPPEQTEDSHELLVCHGNVIRYFVCRALQFPPEGWHRMSVANCGLTWLSIRPNGRVSLRGLSDTGHLSPELISFN